LHEHLVARFHAPSLVEARPASKRYLVREGLEGAPQELRAHSTRNVILSIAGIGTADL
jgi:hypothetical protein